MGWEVGRHVGFWVETCRIGAERESWSHGESCLAWALGEHDGRTGTECGLLRAVGRKEVILSEYSQACCLQLSVSMSLGTEAWAPALPLPLPPYTERKP